MNYFYYDTSTKELECSFDECIDYDDLIEQIEDQVLDLKEHGLLVDKITIYAIHSR